MEKSMTTNGAVETTSAFPHVWDKRAMCMRLVTRRLASVVPAIQGTTLPATGFGQLGQVAGYLAPVALPSTTPFSTTTLDALELRTARPPV